ncbi:MAG: hypothetical protein JW936_09890 [Sedimentisphaerales bacterium]|nr:hypothetical protein [Sedimentisphaerales bacterium]
MKRMSVVLILAVSFLLLTNGAGCVRSYVDPTIPKVAYTDLQIRQRPQPICVFLEFQTLGVPNILVSESVLPQVYSIFHASSLFSQVDRVRPNDNTVDQIHITINNTATVESTLGNIGNTAIGAVTLGQSESMVTDHYDFTATYHPAGSGEPVSVAYSHAIHSTAGKPIGLEDAEPLEPDIAFERMLENLLLKTLYDLQQQGYLL